MDVTNIIPVEQGLTLCMTGYLAGNRINRVYLLVAFGLSPGISFGGRFSTEGRRVLPVILSDDPLPISIEDLDKRLKQEGVEGIQYSYLKNGEQAYKKRVMPEALKRRT